MNDSLHLDIICPEKKCFSGMVASITLPGKVGKFTILPHHAPIISSLTEGDITYKAFDGAVQSFHIMGGFMEMSNNQVTICAEV